MELQEYLQQMAVVMHPDDFKMHAEDIQYGVTKIQRQPVLQFLTAGFRFTQARQMAANIITQRIYINAKGGTTDEDLAMLIIRTMHLIPQSV